MIGPLVQHLRRLVLSKRVYGGFNHVSELCIHRVEESGRTLELRPRPCQYIHSF